MKKRRSYIEECDRQISNMNPKVRILYIESDYYNVLDTLLSDDCGSVFLRRLLGLREQYSRYRHGVSFEKVYMAALRKEAPSADNAPEFFRPDAQAAQKKLEEDVRRAEAAQQQPRLRRDGSGSFSYSTESGMRYTLTLENAKLTDRNEADDGTPVIRKDSYSFQLQPDSPAASPLRVKVERQTKILGEGKDPGTLPFFLWEDVSTRQLRPEEFCQIVSLYLKHPCYTQKYLVFTGSYFDIPKQVKPFVKKIHLAPPTGEDYFDILNEYLRGNRERENLQESLQNYALILGGVNDRQFRNICGRLTPNLMVEDIHTFENSQQRSCRLKDYVAEEKRAEGEGVLTYIDVDDPPSVIGMSECTRWINSHIGDLVHPSDLFPAPKGMIYTGVPGSGKSLSARQLCYQWNHHKDQHTPVAMIDFNISAILGSHVGDSEHNMDIFLSKIEDAAPAVVLVDEVEKVFYKDKNGASMHETQKHIMMKFLKWMQDRKMEEKPIFIVMTSNNISLLPDEFIRSGRVDSRWFVFMPGCMDLTAMMYSMLRPYAEEGREIFEKKFCEEIREKCELIDRYNSSYGSSLNQKKDENLEKELHNGLKESSLGEVLDEVAKHFKANNRTPFLTGSDLDSLLKKDVLLRLRFKNTDGGGLKNVTGKDMADMIIECCEEEKFSTIAQWSIENLCRMFIDCDFPQVEANPILPRHQFRKEDGVFLRDEAGGFIKGTSPDNSYDRYLQEAFVKAIEDISKKERFEDLQRAHQEKQMKAWEENRPYEKLQRAHQEKQMKAWEENRPYEKLQRKLELEQRRQELKRAAEQLAFQQIQNEHWLEQQKQQKKYKNIKSEKEKQLSESEQEKILKEMEKTLEQIDYGSTQEEEKQLSEQEKILEKKEETLEQIDHGSTQKEQLQRK